jgi:starch synthase
MKDSSSIDSIRNIWMLTREYEGMAGAGGVKDVCRQLAEALARSNRQVSVVMPFYGFMSPEQLGFSKLEITLDVDMNYVGIERREFVKIWQANLDPWNTEKDSGNKNPIKLYLIDAHRYREKQSVYTYTAEEEAQNPGFYQGDGHFDYFAMNVLLQKAALSLMITLEEKPDVIHCHDAHTAVLPAIVREIEGYRHYFRNTGLVVTIHNAGYGYHQDIGDLDFAQAITGLSRKTIDLNLSESRFDPFLVASSHALLNTVSENYARELMETDDDRLTGWLGHRLGSRGFDILGITNGINPASFDTSKADLLGIAASYSTSNSDFAGKRICRKQLILNLAKNKIPGIIQGGFLSNKPDQPLLTFIGRMSSQKGVDKLIEALETLLPLDSEFQVLILGSGARHIEQELLDLAEKEKYYGRIALLRGYDPALANQIYAAGDFFLIPSQYEPCGLTDFISQLFGNIPIVHHVGGLVKVIDQVTGFTYGEHSSAALMGAIQKALTMYRTEPEKLRQMQMASYYHIRENYTWDKVIEKYLSLYNNAINR